MRLGNWLTAEQGHELWQAPNCQRVKGKRDRALLALLLACGPRRHEAVNLRLHHLQQREDHWLLSICWQRRTYPNGPIPDWVVAELNEWLKSAETNRGRIFRKVNKIGHVWGDGMTEKAVWHVVKECAKRIGVTKLAPHDLRRTCAKLCQASGGELEQIQFLLGHVSVHTTNGEAGMRRPGGEPGYVRIGDKPGRIRFLNPAVFFGEKLGSSLNNVVTRGGKSGFRSRCPPR